MSAAVWGYPYILNCDNLQRYVSPINKGRENNKQSLIETSQENNYTEGSSTAGQHKQYVLMETYSMTHWL